ncbi:MAG: FoF1 ATP synthase subunit delta [Planctomycetia bacterium]
MIRDAVAVRWTGALWNLAARQGATAAVSADMERLSTHLSSGVARARMLHAGVDASARRAGVEGALVGCHELTRNFVALAFDRRREALLVDAPAAWRARARLENNEVEGVVETARPLGEPEMAKLATRLGSVLEKKVALTNKVVPELVGGARVVAGNRMIDWSVQGRMDALRRRMLDARLPS